MTPEELFDLIKKMDSRFLSVMSTGAHGYIDSYIMPYYRLDGSGSTACGLRNAFIQFFRSNSSTQLNLKTFEQEMGKNSDWLLSNSVDSSAIFTYQFSIKGSLYKNNKESMSIGHTFTIIHYKNVNEQIRYRFFQSYVFGYSLSQFISESESNHNSHDFSQEEFTLFLKELIHFSKAQSWTQEIKKFYKQYFNMQLDWDDVPIIDINDLSRQEYAPLPSLPLIVLNDLSLQEYPASPFIIAQHAELAVDIQADGFLMYNTKEKIQELIDDFKGYSHKVIGFSAKENGDWDEQIKSSLLTLERNRLTSNLDFAQKIMIVAELKYNYTECFFVSKKCEPTLTFFKLCNALPNVNSANTNAPITTAYRGSRPTKLETQPLGPNEKHPLLCPW
jgi:hypothetical protein